MELYGEGLERIFDAIAEDGSRRRCATRLVEDGVVASLMLIHDLYPVPLEDARAGGARQRAARTWSPTAATSSCSGSRTASRGCGSRARATAARRRRRRWSWRSSRRCRRRRRTSRGSTSRASSSRRAAGARQLRAADGRAAARRSAAGRRSTGSARRCPARTGDVARRSLLVANVAGDLLAYRNRCAGCGGALDHGDLSGGTLHCPPCARRFDLPRAGRCVSDDGAAARAGAAAARRRRRCGSRSPHDGRSGNGACRRATSRRPPPGRAAAARAAPARPDEEQCELCTLGIAADHRHLLHLDERRILCVCETCWAVRSGDAEFRPVGNRTVVARRLRAHRRAVGVVPDPDRARVLHGLDGVGRRGRAVPEPGRRDRVRARPRGVGARCAPTTRCWRRSRPTPRRWSSTAWPTRRST